MSSLSKSFRLSSSLNEEFMVSKKKGIVSILGSECERSKSAASLRRTLSADMSSKKWLSQHGFSPLKKIASSEEFPVSMADSSSSEGEEEYDNGTREKETEPRGQFEIWSSIQQEKQKQSSKEELEKPGQFDIWSSILSQKAKDDNKSLPPPYIHPLVKRSASGLSEKSLEICTESLGSETGSDGFSSYPPSETGDAEEEKEEEQEENRVVVAQKYEDIDDWRVSKYNLAATSKKLPQKSFPPPLPSLSRRDGASLHMRTRRDNGRLVLEAVSVPSQNNFRAERQHDRLVLTFINNPNEEEEPKTEEEKDMELFEVEIENSADEQIHEGDEEDDEEEEEGMEAEAEIEEEEELEKIVNERGRGGGGGGSGEMKFVMEQAPKFSSGVINVHRLALMMNKPMALANRDPTWPNKFNEMAKFEEGSVEEAMNPITPLTQSLPPRPPVSRMIPMPAGAAAAVTAKAAASFNAYEYYWKPKPMTATTKAAAAAAGCLSPMAPNPQSLRSKDNNSKKIISNEKKQDLVVLRGNKGEYLVPLSKGCKEARRSLLFWEPYCIATS